MKKIELLLLAASLMLCYTVDVFGQSLSFYQQISYNSWAKTYYKKVEIVDGNTVYRVVHEEDRTPGRYNRKNIYGEYNSTGGALGGNSLMSSLLEARDELRYQGYNVASYYTANYTTTDRAIYLDEIIQLNDPKIRITLGIVKKEHYLIMNANCSSENSFACEVGIKDESSKTILCTEERVEGGGVFRKEFQESDQYWNCDNNVGEGFIHLSGTGMSYYLDNTMVTIPITSDVLASADIRSTGDRFITMNTHLDADDYKASLKLNDGNFFYQQCSGTATNSSFTAEFFNTSYSLRLQLKDEPITAMDVMPYKGVFPFDVESITYDENDGILFSDCSINGLLFNFFSSPVFDYYYDRSQCRVSLQRKDGSVKDVVLNTGIGTPNGLLVTLGGVVENGDVLTLELYHRTKKVITKTFTYVLGINPPPKPVLSATRQLACNDDDVSVAVRNSDATASYRWTVNGSLQHGVSGSELGKAYMSSGNNSIVATVVSATGCAATSDAINVRLYALAPDLTFSNVVRCNNAPAFDLLEQLGGADKSAVLNNANGYTYSLSSPRLSIDGSMVTPEKSAAGIHAVTLTVNREGCSVARTAEVNLLPLFEKPRLSASTTHFCDDGSNHVTLRLDNYSTLSMTPKAYLLTSGNNTASWPALSSTVTFAPNKGDDGIGTQVYVTVTEQSAGCTLMSNEVNIEYYQSPRRPTLQGNLSFCGTEDATYLVHSNPEYHVQYWLYDVTGGKEQFLRHKGANFWIFRPDQHDPKAGSPNEVNEEAYYDLRLSEGSYEIRATHDQNSCVTTLPFTVTNFNNNLFEMVAKSTPVKVCNSSMEGIGVLDLFEDCEMKTILKSSQGANYSCGWTVKKDGKFLSAMPGSAMRASVYNVEAGVYSVELTVTNTDGCAKTFNSSLIIEARPAAFTIAADNAHVCNDAQVIISASNADVAGLTYAWQLNNTSIGENQSNISPSLLSGANYVTATATNASGCSSTSNRLEVNRHIFNPDIRFKEAKFEYCASDPMVNLLDLLEGSDKTKVLQQQDGITYGITQSASGLYFDNTTIERYVVDPSRSTAREYVITLSMIQNGCEVRKEAKLTIKAVPASFSITSDKALVCDGDLVTITASGQADGLSYQWYINNSLVPGQSSKTLVTALPDGSNSIYAVAVNSNGCSIASAPITVSGWVVKTNVAMAISPISECEVEDGELDLYTYLTGDAGDLEMLKDPNNEKGLKFRYEGMQVGYNATAYHIATFANNPAKQNGDPYGLKFSIWQESVTGCVHTYERNVKVLPRPKAFAITSSAVIACNEDTAFMTASNNDVVGLTYRWSVDGVVKNGVTGALLAKSALHDGYNTVGVTAVNANGCATASVNKITIKLAGFNPAVRFKETLSYCQNSGVFTLADIIEGDDKQQMLDRTGGYTHKVTSTPTGLFAESVTGVYSVSPSQKAAGDYLVRLSMDNGECEVYRTATLTILPVPAAFTVVASTTDVVCNSDDVTITATNKDMSGLTYQWYVNNAPVPNVTGASLAKDYLAQGNNTVYAIATNGSGCSVRSSNTATVTLHTLAPEVAFTTSDYSRCANEDKFSLHGLLTGGDKEKVLGRQDGMTYEFTHSPTGLFIDNTFDNDEVDPAQSAPGMYTVTFRIMRNGCEVSRTTTLTIMAVPAVFTVAASTSNVVCNDEAVTITTNNSGVAGLNYQWYVNNGLVSGVTGASLAKDKLSEGGNEVYTTATNGSGCVVRSSNMVTVTLHTLAPEVAFTTSDYSRCANEDKFSLHGLLTGGDKEKVLGRQDGMNYEFTHSPTGLSIDNTFDNDEVDPAQSTSGIYTVTLRIMRNGCEVSRTTTLTILPVPATFTVAASTTNVVCNDEAVTITTNNSGVAGLNYQWYVNNGLVSGVTGASLAKDYLAQGNNTVYAIATNGSGCSVRSSNTATVTLHTLAPEVDFTTSEYSYCANAGKFSLHGLLTGGDKEKVLGRQDGMNYEFTHSPTGLSIDNTFDNDEVDPAQSTPGMYTVTLRIQRNGCEVKRTATLTILPIPETFSVAASTTNVVCNDEAVMITASNNGVAGLNYQWYVNNALVSGVTGANLAKSYLAQGSNAVYAITTNNSGCAVRSDNTTTVTLHTLAPEVAFTTSEYSYCANAGKFSLHGLLTGGDKEKVLGRQDNMAYDFASSPSGLSIDNTFGDYRVDPAQSTPQAYIVTLWVRRSGCEISRTTTLTINVVPSNFNITTTKPSTVIDGKTIYLLCNSSSFDAATTALANTASVEWYLGTTKITTTTAGSYAYTIGSDQRAQVSAIAISDKGCQVNSNNVLTVDRRTVDFSGVVVNTSSTAYCNSDDNINYFTFVTAGNKSDIEGSTNGWGYTLNSGGINQCGGDNNTKMLCLQNSTPGTYKTVFTVTKNSCVATWDKTITIKPVPGGTTLTPDVSNLCASGTATLTATTQGYVNSYTYNWYKDNALVRSGYTDRTHNYTAEGGVTQTKWKVAAVDNGCTGAISNEVTVNNNQPTMEAAFVKSSFTSDEGLQIKLLSMVNVDVNSIAFTVTQQSNGSTQTFTPTPTNNVYLIKFSGNISVRRYTIEVSFKDDKGGACSNSITIGEIDKSSSTSYTVVSGNTLPAQQSQQSSSTSTRTVTPKVADATTAGDYDDEAERLYREYVAGLRNDEHKAFLAPTYTGSAEDVKLLIYSQQPEQVTIKVYSSTGNLIVTKPLSLYGGITEYRLSGREKPQTIGMYYVMIEYANGARETLKGVVK